MSDQILTDRSELTSLATGDKAHIVDVSDTTDDAAGSSKWFSLSTLVTFLQSVVQTLTNKTIDADNNTVSNLAHGAEVDSPSSSVHGVTGSVVGTTDTQTLTNKRITPRVSTEVSSATPTIDTDSVDMHSITALAVAVTSMTTNLSGTPTNGQKLIIRFKDNGTGRAITWGASFEAKGTALPTTTVASKVLTVGFLYDTVTSKWGCVASLEES